MESKNISMSLIKITGYLRMSDKQRRKNNKGQELFHFIPLSTNNLILFYPNYLQLNVQIFVASDAVSKRKSASNKFLYDLYVNIIIISDTIKPNSSNNIWYGRVDEIIGECNDLNHCSLALACNRNLFKDNKAFIRKSTNCMLLSPTSLSTNNNTTTNNIEIETNTIFKTPQILEIPIYNNRYDLRNNKQYTIFSIDPLNCIDIDDAIHIRMLSPIQQESSRTINRTNNEDTTATTQEELPDYEIGIHISDVTNYIKATESNTNDDRLLRIVQEAFHRSFTVYLPDKQIPILPPYLSHEYCSLQANQDRYVISCILTITPSKQSQQDNNNTTTTYNNNNNNNMDYISNKYKIISCKFQKSLISSDGAYNYDEVDDYLLQNPSLITSMNNNNKIINKTKLTRLVKNSLKHLQKVFDTSISSHKIIEILMVQANYQVAKLINNSNHILPACLLIRQLPHLIKQQGSQYQHVVEEEEQGQVIKNIDVLQKIPIDFTAQPAEYIYSNNMIDSDILLTMKVKDNDSHHNQVYYSDIEKRHSSLNLSLYTNFTSPIRRFVDQIVHVLVNKCIDEQQEPQSILSNKNINIVNNQLSSLTLTNNNIGPNNQVICPWLSLFTVDNIKYINEMRRLHRKYQRDMTILNFVFNQCELANANEVTISAKAIVLPFRLSNKYNQYKTDLYVISTDYQFIYPLRIHTLAQKHLIDIKYDIKLSQVSINTIQQQQQQQPIILAIWQEIPIFIHCMKSAANFKKKCVVSSTEIHILTDI